MSEITLIGWIKQPFFPYPAFNSQLAPSFLAGHRESETDVTSEFDHYAVSQPPSGDLTTDGKDHRGVLHALPLALLMSSAMWVVVFGLLYRL